MTPLDVQLARAKTLGATSVSYWWRDGVLVCTLTDRRGEGFGHASGKDSIEALRFACDAYERSIESGAVNESAPAPRQRPGAGHRVEGDDVSESKPPVNSRSSRG